MRHAKRQPTRRMPRLTLAMAPLLLCGAQALAQSSPSSEALARAAQAASNVATTAMACTMIGNFYWEIGTGAGKLDGKAVVRQPLSTRYNATTEVNIASASKWVFGAYVNEATKSRALTADEVAKLHMTSGYTSQNLGSCQLAQKTKNCLPGGKTAANENSFFYDGGHLQQLALDLKLGELDKKGLIAEYNKKLGNFGMRFGSLNVAGGMAGSGAGYGQFLQKVLRGELAIGSRLGSDEVCTNTQGGCAAKYSPSDQAAWGYSHAHWVERDATGTVQAYSSPGLFGFYPWISADKRTYGVIARESLMGEAYNLSAACGRAMRQAFNAELVR